jgi:hypothetical protein
MKFVATAIPDVLLLEPTIYEDAREFFFESFNQKRFDAAVARNVGFVQDNYSRSVKHLLRGLHYQIRRPQGKLVRVVAGEVLDVAVDLRRSSPTFGKFVSSMLSAANKKQLCPPRRVGCPLSLSMFQSVEGNEGEQPVDINLAALVRQAWEMGAPQITLIHGHCHNRGISDDRQEAAALQSPLCGLRRSPRQR